MHSPTPRGRAPVALPSLQVIELRTADAISADEPLPPNVILPHAVLTGSALVLDREATHVPLLFTFFPQFIVLDFPVECLDSGLEEDGALYLAPEATVDHLRRALWAELKASPRFLEILDLWLKKRDSDSEPIAYICASSHWDEVGQYDPPRLELTESDLREAIEKGVC